MLLVKSGLIWEEFITIMAIITPTCGIYLGVFFKHYQKSVKALINNNVSTELQFNEINIPYPKIAINIIPTHFLIILAFYFLVVCIPLKANEVNIFLGLIETAFGSYVGYVIYPIFGFEYISK